MGEATATLSGGVAKVALSSCVPSYVAPLLVAASCSTICTIIEGKIIGSIIDGGAIMGCAGAGAGEMGVVAQIK